jgi:hypothetical protein
MNRLGFKNEMSFRGRSPTILLFSCNEQILRFAQDVSGAHSETGSKVSNVLR